MATIPLSPVVSGASLDTEYKTLYSVPVGTSRIGIDAVVFNNYSATTATYSVRLVQSTPGNVLDEVITEKSVRAKSNDLGPAMIGQALLTGGEIQAKASIAGAINVAITVTEITT